MFKIGDRVTGTNRSYARSIYELVEIKDSNCGIYKPIAYKGRKLDGEEQRRYTNEREHDEFRYATDLEYKFASSRSHYDLMDMIRTLIS